MAGEEVREHIGRVFVDLTAKLYGGEIQKNGHNSHSTGNPDIINWQRDQAYESKASISSDHHKITPRQIEHYTNLLDSEFPLTNPEAYYFFWQYKKRGISRFQDRQLEKNLIANINRLLIVSFDIIDAGQHIWKTTGENCFWGRTYMFRSSERRQLTINPEHELARMGLDPDNYHVTRETIPAKQYKYKWWYLPQFNITTIIKKEMRGLERK